MQASGRAATGHLPAVLQPAESAAGGGDSSACGFHGLGVARTVRSPAAFSPAKYKPGDEPPPDSRAALIGGSCRPMAPGSLVIAQNSNGTPGKRLLAGAVSTTAWVLANRFVSAPSRVQKSLAQFEPYFGALEYPWAGTTRSWSIPWCRGAPSTPGYHDPAYPSSGVRAALGRLVRWPQRPGTSCET